MFAYLMEYFLRNGLYVQKWKKNQKWADVKHSYGVKSRKEN